MSKARLLGSTIATLAVCELLVQSPVARANDNLLLEIGRKSSPVVAQYASNLGVMPPLSHAAKLALLQQKVKYVFVLFQENRSFDQHFGTFPGADGLFSAPPQQTPGFYQPLIDTDGREIAITPFRIPANVVNAQNQTVPLYPADTDSVDHSHRGIDNSINLSAAGIAQNNRYALNEEGLTTNASGQIVSLATGLPATANPTLVQKQRGELVMSHLDCDTIPFLWNYADRFTMFDNFHQTIIAPSTPNAIAMIAGQSGDTQWVLHPTQSASVPVTGDPGPFPGSNSDPSASKPTYGPNDSSPKTPTVNQTYASLPLSFMANQINTIITADQNPTMDLLDVQNDITTIASKNMKLVPWGWYQEGYDHEPTDGTAAASYATYITHHNGPQYFGYIADNTTEQNNLHGLGDFFTAVSAKTLPDHGVFYVRGGYGNLDGMTPLDPNPTVRANFAGNDDHPAYSDAHISEALVADEVNAIVASPYWKNSAIIITYDETDGLYDHAAFKPRTFDPAGYPLDGGPRIPAIVVSPYSVAHGISHEYSEHSSVIKFIDELFNLVPLGNLPDEAAAMTLGNTTLGQSNLGPADTLPGMGDLFTAFDNARLLGFTAPLPASYASIPAATVHAVPPYGGQGCKALNITPTDIVGGDVIDPPPADFNPRPGTTPGIPTSVTNPLSGGGTGPWTP